ncbi:PAS domain-containing protein [Vacuolonema iberomarrocanum]|uniref:PAS domain-containing protein n=1 Tax=Vacuolonema iberomarrocanum TaxID=3454632 RepID=UPI001A064043|nr:PAS domain-containing protein [filamentous cyanobacterium LEGE 07170]
MSTARPTKVGLRSAIAPHPLIVSPQASVREAVTKMYTASIAAQTSASQCARAAPSVTWERCYQEARASCVLVVETAAIIGILTEQDVVRLCGAAGGATSAWETLPVRAVMDPAVVVLAAADFRDNAVAECLLKQTGRRQLPVVGDRGEILGLITRDTLRECQKWEASQVEKEPIDQMSSGSGRSHSQQLRLELKLLEPILDVILSGYWDWDIASDDAYLSPSFKHLLGYTDEEWPNLPGAWKKLIFPDDLPVMLACFERHVQSRGQIPFHSEVRYRHKEGSPVWVVSSGQVIAWDEAGNPLRMIGCHGDMTRQKQAEMLLRRSEAEWEHFFCITLDLLCIAGMDGRFYRLNQAWESTLGYSISELEGKPFLDYVHPDDITPTLEAIATLEHQKTLQAFVNRYRCKDGSYRDIEWSSRIYGNLIYAVARDITQQKKVVAELRQTSADLEASNRELEAFAYSVSHELRSPLRAIDGFSQALREDYGDQLDDTAQDYFNRIHRNVNRMGKIIENLLRLARVSRSDLQCQSLNLSHLVLDQLEELHAAEPERQVEAIVAPDVMVYADPTLMRVVVANLVQNAWKFTRHHSTACIEFGVRQQADQPIYFISDDGAGFDMAYAEMLFGLFQRLHSTQEFPGTGIGLATVQRAIYRQGGIVWVEGAIEQGATVYFTLSPACHPMTSPNPEVCKRS